MLVLNLCCAHEHGFEGWFASADDFESQRERSLIECPLCANAEIKRMPSAPRLNVSGQREPSPDAQVLQALRTSVARSEDVGSRFAEEARRIHYGEAQARDIRGKASLHEARDLAEEGIQVLPLPSVLKEGLQ